MKNTKEIEKILKKMQEIKNLRNQLKNKKPNLANIRGLQFRIMRLKGQKERYHIAISPAHCSALIFALSQYLDGETIIRNKVTKRANKMLENVLRFLELSVCKPTKV